MRRKPVQKCISRGEVVRSRLWCRSKNMSVSRQTESAFRKRTRNSENTSRRMVKGSGDATFDRFVTEGWDAR